MSKIPQMWVFIKSGQYLRLMDNKHQKDVSSFGVSGCKRTLYKSIDSTFNHCFLGSINPKISLMIKCEF